MSNLELKTEIEQWLARLPADKLEQVLAYVSFISQRSTNKTAPVQSKPSAEQKRADFRRHCGAIHSGSAIGADNDSIDVDLADSYGA
jgi:hypothetical protein